MLKSILPTVQRYEDEEEAALQASGVIECEDDLYEARRDLRRIGEQIFERKAKSAGGVAVMARAVGAVAHLDANDRFVTLRWGPKLAENVLRQEAHR